MSTWTVKRKLATLVTSIIVAFACLTVFLLSRQTAATADIHSLYEKDYRAASIIGQIDGLLTRVDINILRMIAIGDPASIANWKAQNTERFNKVDQLLVEFERVVRSEHGRVDQGPGRSVWPDAQGHGTPGRGG